MDVPDRQVAAVRRMWTFRAFVWGLRLILVGLVLLIPAYFVPRWFSPAAIALVASGVALGIPFRVLAFWRKILVPLAAGLAGFLLTIPLRLDSSTRLRLSPGRILGQTLRDIFNPKL